jgi:uncharacterized protein GlcG (DUF336 family)
MKKIFVLTVLALTVQNAFAACSDIDHATLAAAATSVVPSSTKPNGGLGFPMWVTVVDETGMVCHVVNSTGVAGTNSTTAWLGSRIISAQKANTANAFSHNGLALSTANLYSAVQPGGSLFGLQESNPVNASVAYLGDTTLYGTETDPLVNQRIGGVNVFGGGLALYKNKVKVGAIGVSGDTSCTDHVVAWKIRAELGLDDFIVGLGGAASQDAMIQDIKGSSGSKGGFGHPSCLNNPTNANDGNSITGNKAK